MLMTSLALALAAHLFVAQVPCEPGDEPASCGPDRIALSVQVGETIAEFRLMSGVTTNLKIAPWTRALEVKCTILDDKTIEVVLSNSRSRRVGHGKSIVVDPVRELNTPDYGKLPMKLSIQ